MIRGWPVLCAAVVVATLVSNEYAAAASGEPRVAGDEVPRNFMAATQNLARQEGYWPLQYDAAADRLFLEVSRARLGEEFLYLRALSTGLGLVQPRVLGDLERAGIDNGTEALVRLERRGARLLLIQKNLSFRALAPAHPELARGVEEAFAPSVLGAFPIVREKGDRLTIDATDFFMRDAMDVRGRVREAEQGEVSVDRARSAFNSSGTKSFPTNLEVDVLLTFTGEKLGAALTRHVPDPHSFSLRQHHSFVKLPEPGFRARVSDPRIAYGDHLFLDFSRPFPQPYQTAIINRYRLEKKDPAAAISEPVRPLVFYLDRGIPEPIRGAYREGVLWWNQAFEGAGFRNAVRVEDLPPDMDPLDARYNVILWVYNSAPDVATGPSVIDPRTGEMIRTTVRIDSHRPLLYANVYGGLVPSLAKPVAVDEFVRGQLMWHAAHEVGHPLGIPDMNYVGEDGRPVSIGTLPAPLVTLNAQGRIEVAEPIREGPGPFDRLAIRYAYTPFASAEAEAAGLQAIVGEAIRNGIRSPTDFLSALPRAGAFLNGKDLFAELERVMRVRSVLLENFDERAVAPGTPLWRLNERLYPVYLYHRPTLEAVIRMVGGMDFTYAVRGDGQKATEIIAPDVQRRALASVLGALSPLALEIPERVVAMIPPRPGGYDDEPAYVPRYFPAPAGPALDPLAAARVLTTYAVRALLDRERMARLVSFHARDAANPSMEEVVQALVDSTRAPPAARAPAERPMHRALRAAVQNVIREQLLALANDAAATPEVRAIAHASL